MVSQRSLLSAPRLLTILLASFSVISSVNGATPVDEDVETINGITLTEADQAPECLYECPALEKYGSGSELPQCVTEQLKDSPYADMVKSGEYDSDEETQQAINEIMSCVCTDVDFVKELADCVFNEPCGNNNTAVYEAISIGYKVCGVMYNVTYPAPTEVVKMLQIPVPTGVIVPTTITGVPQGTTWPGKTVIATPSATISSSNPPSATATSSSSSSNSSNIVTANTNAAMKSSPSYYLVFLAFFAFLAISVSAQSNSTNPITSTITSSAATTTTVANGTLTSTSTVAVTSGVSNGTLSTSTATNNLTATTTTRSSSSSSRTSTTTAGSSASASASDVPGNAIRNGASFGLVAAGAVAAAFLF